MSDLDIENWPIDRVLAFYVNIVNNSTRMPLLFNREKLVKDMKKCRDTLVAYYESNSEPSSKENKRSKEEKEQ